MNNAPVLRNTKRPIIQFFASCLPDFRFALEHRPLLIFRSDAGEHIYRYIAVQRDSASKALAVDLATTYNPNWRGAPAVPLGMDTGLANLRLRQAAVEASDNWFSYQSTASGLETVLNEILRQLQQFASPFFAKAEHQLRSNQTLQLARREAKQISMSERAGLENDLRRAGYLLDQLQHPAYVRLRDTLRTAWTSHTSPEERAMTNRIACDVLIELPPQAA